jgi:hypothetical protein
MAGGGPITERGSTNAVGREQLPAFSLISTSSLKSTHLSVKMGKPSIKMYYDVVRHHPLFIHALMLVRMRIWESKSFHGIEITGGTASMLNSSRSSSEASWSEPVIDRLLRLLVIPVQRWKLTYLSQRSVYAKGPRSVWQDNGNGQFQTTISLPCSIL